MGKGHLHLSLKGKRKLPRKKDGMGMGENMPRKRSNLCKGIKAGDNMTESRNQGPMWLESRDWCAMGLKSLVLREDTSCRAL